jgi:hypothetical protein
MKKRIEKQNVAITTCMNDNASLPVRGKDIHTRYGTKPVLYENEGHRLTSVFESTELAFIIIYYSFYILSSLAAESYKRYTNYNDLTQECRTHFLKGSHTNILQMTAGRKN